MSWKLKLATTLAITDLQIEILLGDLKMYFQNLMEEERIDNFIHNLINEMGVELLGDVWKYEQTKVVAILETVSSSKYSSNI